MDDKLKLPDPPGYRVVIAVPVQWGEQDAFGHVNNTYHLRWCETARIEYFTRLGLTQSLASHGLGPILASITCNYRRQLAFPDTVRVGARVTRLGRTSLVMEHAIFSDAQQAVVADGSSVIVVFDYASNQPHPIPDELRRTIESLEGLAADGPV